jgi:hypothetical protein|tara:strand:+ start:92 stop:406 length:315 start_codon:yes stop_codon:yes gene_type:complete
VSSKLASRFDAATQALRPAILDPPPNLIGLLIHHENQGFAEEILKLMTGGHIYAPAGAEWGRTSPGGSGIWVVVIQVRNTAVSFRGRLGRIPAPVVTNERTLGM